MKDFVSKCGSIGNIDPLGKKKWEQMKAIYDACTAANVELPEEVSAFFGFSAPDAAGVTVYLNNSPAVSKYNEGTREGFEVDVTKLPKGVVIVRFFNSY